MNNAEISNNETNYIINRMKEVEAIMGALAMLNRMPIPANDTEEFGVCMIRELVLDIAERKNVIEWNDEKHTYICRYTKESIHLL